ncbi:unnamed protein product [Brassica napus]|nr:unnamed protein product [Brassica napus]
MTWPAGEQISASQYVFHDLGFITLCVLPPFWRLICLRRRDDPLLGFGLRLSLFEDAERLVSDASEKKHLKSCIEQAKEQLTEVDHQPTVRSQGYLFEGHLTVDREPPQPQCLVQQNLMSAFSSIVAGESSNAADILEDGGPPRAPLASKEVVKKLLVIVFSEEMLKTLGAEVECCICKENLVIGDKMQELP